MATADDDVTALVDEAEALVDVRRYGEAIERAQEAARRAPQDPRPFQAWSRALLGDDQFDGAARMAEESIRLAPDDAIGHRLRSRALVHLAVQERGASRTHNAGVAVATAREAVRLEPSNPNSHLVLAEALSLANGHAEADAEVQKAIRSAPNSVATWVTASWVALRAKNWSSAITASQRALALDANNHAAMNNLGVALRAAGKRREGSQVLANAARIDPDDRTARRNLSRAGVRTARLVVMVLLIPIGFVTHLGVTLYLAFAIGSNVLISRRPDLVLRAERWAAPIALFFARGAKAPGSSDPGAVGVGSELRDTTGGDWSATRGRQRIRPSVLMLVVVCAWAVTLVMVLVAFAVPGTDRLIAAVLVLACAGLALWPTLTLARRQR